jgi:hypothetical protein
MSIAIMSLVWRMELDHAEKMVLLALADAANDDGVTWLPMSGRSGKMGLRQKTSLSVRKIQYCLRALESAGHLRRDEKPGKGVIYTVQPCTACTPARDAPVHKSTGTPAQRAPKPSVTVIGTKVPPLAERVVTAWNEGPARKGATRALKLDGARRKMLKARIDEHGEAAIFAAIAGIASSPHHCGSNDRGWRANLGWLLQSPRNFIASLERAASEAPPSMSVAERIKFLQLCIRNYENIGREAETGPWRRELAELLGEAANHG